MCEEVHCAEPGKVVGSAPDHGEDGAMNGHTRQWLRMLANRAARVDWQRIETAAMGAMIALAVVVACAMVKAVLRGGP